MDHHEGEGEHQTCSGIFIRNLQQHYFKEWKEYCQVFIPAEPVEAQPGGNQVSNVLKEYLAWKLEDKYLSSGLSFCKRKMGSIREH